MKRLCRDGIDRPPVQVITCAAQKREVAQMRRFVPVAVIVCLLFASARLDAQPPRLFGPKDARLKPLKDLNGYFPFQVPKSQREWRIRKAQMRRHLLVSVGLWPLPQRTPLKPVVHSSRDMGDYIVEKAYFQSMPGFYVTGNIYRPKNAKGKLPAILCPHGHWPNGRFYDAGEGPTKQQIAKDAEQFEDGGRSPLQSRCVHLARMGCLVFHYDMIGYADSIQIPYKLAHRITKKRPHMDHIARWGLFSPQAESRLQSVMGLQTWNSIRALDYLSSRKDVDPKRIAVTGASGGGTQTFMVCAVDPRPAASFPAVMVSTAMQGGCTCENACLLRIGTGNIEFAAMFAPKPQGLTAADDWTKQMDRFGFPELRRHYRLLGRCWRSERLPRCGTARVYVCRVAGGMQRCSALNSLTADHCLGRLGAGRRAGEHLLRLQAPRQGGQELRDRSIRSRSESSQSSPTH